MGLADTETLWIVPSLQLQARRGVVRQALAEALQGHGLVTRTD